MNISINVNGTVSTIQLTNDTTSSLLLAGGETFYIVSCIPYIFVAICNSCNLVCLHDIRIVPRALQVYSYICTYQANLECTYVFNCNAWQFLNYSIQGEPEVPDAGDQGTTVQHKNLTGEDID